MLAVITRVGPPAAMNCPVTCCDECGEPIDRHGNAVWYEYREGESGDVERSPVYFVHKRCAGPFESRHAATCPEGRGRSCMAHYRWYELSEFLAHLSHNLEHPISEDPGLADGSVTYRVPKSRLEDGQ